jgi:peroxiredoxin
MALTPSTMLPLGTSAPDFRLPDTDGRTASLADFREAPALLVMFICNHCPYVRAVAAKIVRDTDALAQLGIGSIAIMSNDAAAYPADSFDNMKTFAAEHGFRFPYVIDESQDVARAYDAMCTPDFFGFDRDLALAYHGRLDASGRNSDPTAARELFDAMSAVARGGRVPLSQSPSIGCSIKWRTAS